jgi:uncharacterized protein (TIGR03067 family)
MRRTVCLLAALLVLPSLGSDEPTAFDGATTRDGLEGTWELVSSGYGGQQSPPLPLNSPCIQTYRRGKWTYHQAGRLVNEGTYKADSRRKPAFLDETTTAGPEAGRTEKYIYQLDGDRLRTAFRQDHRARPKSFDEDGVLIVIYKRVK